MTSRFTTEEIVRLAPDAASAKSGRDLAQARKWVSTGGDDEALWGECQGSGSKPYQVQIDLSEPAFKCSCPSRKFPCKHSLGLMLLNASTDGAVNLADRPGWVVEWLESRRSRNAKAAAKPGASDNPRDEEAASQRRAERISKIRAGMGELAAWTQDLVRQGIAAMPSKGFEFFDGQSRRMVDAQAPGVARLIRALGSCAASGPDWQRPFLERLSLIHLLCTAVEQWESLPAADRAGLEAALGVPVTAEELASLPAVLDRWQVVSREVEIEDRLKMQRTWVLGERTGRSAMLLDFAHGAAPLGLSLNIGACYDAELTFYPGHSLRAAVRVAPRDGERISRPGGCSTFSELLDLYSEALAACPWLERIARPLRDVTPTRAQEGWMLLDRTGASLPMTVRDPVIYTLMAISGGRPIDVVVEFDGFRPRPLTAVLDGRWIPLATLVDEGA